MATDEHAFRMAQVRHRHDGVAQSLDRKVRALDERLLNQVRKVFLVMGFTRHVNEGRGEPDDICREIED